MMIIIIVIITAIMIIMIEVILIITVVIINSPFQPGDFSIGFTIEVRPEIFNVNSSEPVFYTFSIKTSKCSGSGNNINDPYAKLYVSDVVKNINIKVFKLMSRTNETRHVKWHEACKCKCRLDASVCNSKQRWNKDKCRCECKELIDKKICDK